MIFTTPLLSFGIYQTAASAAFRAGIDEVAWRDVGIACFETSFCRPAKGSGYVWLTAQGSDGKTLGILLSDQYDNAIDAWHLTVAALFERAYAGLTRTRDDGYDA